MRATQYLIFFAIAGLLAGCVAPAEKTPSGPLFGGMSGVVYGLLGFSWVGPLVQPRWLIQPSSTLMLIMVGWLVLCLVGYSDLGLLWPVMVILGVLAAVMFPPAITLTAQFSSPQTRGSAMGAFNFAGSLGFAVGPLVGGWAYQRSGYGAAFLVSGTMEILLAVVAAVVVTRWMKRGEI